MEAVKLAENLPQNPKSVKPSKRKCEHCKRADEDGAVTIDGESMLACSQCARKLRAEDEQKRREKQIEAVITPPVQRCSIRAPVRAAASENKGPV